MDTQYEKKYNELMACLRQMHDNNVRRWKMALRSLLIVPTIFLVMLFFTTAQNDLPRFVDSLNVYHSRNPHRY